MLYRAEINTLKTAYRSLEDMATQVNVIESNEDGVKWVEISGTDYGTGWEFQGAEVFGITKDDKILDCEGCPLTKDDMQEVAVRNAVIDN